LRSRQNSQQNFTRVGDPVEVFKDVAPGLEGDAGNTLLNPRAGNPNATLDEELLTAGVDIMQAGQRRGERLANRFPERRDAEQFALETAEDIATQYNIGTESSRERILSDGEEFFDSLPETQSTSSLERGVARADNVITSGVESYRGQGDVVGQTRDALTISGEERRGARENIITGAGTGGSQITGLAVSTAGAVPRALRDDTPGLVEGAKKGVDLTFKEVTENPGDFIGEEVGEEIGEKVIFGAATGGVGLAVSSVPTPEFEVDPKAGFGTSKGQTSGIPGINSETDTGPTTSPGPSTSPGPADPSPDLEPETEPQVLADTDSSLRTDFFDSARTSPSSLEQSLSRPEPVTESTSDVLSRPESDILAEGQIRSESEPQVESEPRIESDVLSEPTTETETRPQPDITADTTTGLERTPDGDLDFEDEDEDLGTFSRFFGASKETQFRSSVGAEVLGVTAESAPDRASQQNPFSIRPIVDED